MAWSDFEEGFSPYLDFEWFAADTEGRVAFLTSGGFGPVPLAVFQSRPAYEAVRACLLGQPSGQPPESCWAAGARRGLYTYDWDARQGQPMPRRPYRRQACPTVPILLIELPDAVRAWLERVRFTGLSFATSPELWPDQEFERVERSRRTRRYSRPRGVSRFRRKAHRAPRKQS